MVEYTLTKTEQYVLYALYVWIIVLALYLIGFMLFKIGMNEKYNKIFDNISKVLGVAIILSFLTLLLIQ